MTETGTRREREKTRHRSEIIDAAEAVFSEKGFHGSTMEDMAARSEFSVGTIYNFFSSKEDLYRTLIEERFRYFHTEMNKAMDQAGDPVEIIRMYIQAKIELSMKYLAFAKLYTRERMGDRFSDNKLWRDTVAPCRDEVIARLRTAFQEGIERGYFRQGLDPAEMATALEGLTDGFMYEWFMYPDKFSFKDKQDVMMRLFLDGVRKP